MSASRAACAALCVLLAVLTCSVAFADPPGGRGRSGRDPGWSAGRPVPEGRPPREPRVSPPGQVTPDKLERWRRMTPEDRDRIRQRYRQWQSLPPERRDRLMERSRRWRELPEGERRFLQERREMYRNAWPEERRVIGKFYARWRELPPERRRALRTRIDEWRRLPAAERDERMMEWPFYRRLPPAEQRVIRWYLFSGPSAPPPPRD